MSFAPLALACITFRPISGCCSKVLLPIIKTHFDSAMSRIELVIAPEPNVEASPATVDAWQSLAQWSMCRVFSTPRANFIIA
ncbi:MAG: hypothetical protein A4E37_01958 [Methanoregulaceae archaeon PtaB.Bin056]|nr:MAG: hypothetical protein A4E37_01958 [Methanoregulaceae archaeon PtaB.Bin056]